MARTHMIWSRRWNCWHRRYVNEDGVESAAGYTNDILQAGIFSTETAMAYHQDGRKRDAYDKAVPLKAVRARMSLAVRQKRAELEAALDAQATMERLIQEAKEA